jgi:hypothetical protein
MKWLSREMRALVSLDIDAIEERSKAATPGPWKLWDGCSWRRFGSETTGQTIIEPVKARSDGHPDLSLREEDAEFVCASRSDIPSLIAEIRKCRSKIEAAQKDVEYWRSHFHHQVELNETLTRSKGGGHEAL